MNCRKRSPPFILFASKKCRMVLNPSNPLTSLRSPGALNLSLRGSIPGKNLFGLWSCNFPATTIEPPAGCGRCLRLSPATRFSFLLYKRGLSGILMAYIVSANEYLLRRNLQVQRVSTHRFTWLRYHNLATRLVCTEAQPEVRGWRVRRVEFSIFFVPPALLSVFRLDGLSTHFIMRFSALSKDRPWPFKAGHRVFEIIERLYGDSFPV